MQGLGFYSLGKIERDNCGKVEDLLMLLILPVSTIRATQ